jgi:hypothetical protein
MANRMTAYKLFRQRNGKLYPLFLSNKETPIGVWLEAEDRQKKGYAHRPGWHCGVEPRADHLSKRGRVWAEVEIEDYYSFKRPRHQGGEWLIAQKMRVVRVLEGV